MPQTEDLDSNSEYDIVPGTTYLIDVNHKTHLIRTKDDEDIILFPQPLNDPNDPLNWSRARKEFHFALVWFMGFLFTTGVNWSGPVYDTMKEYYEISYNSLNISSALCFFFLGMGCIILQPIALTIGRRPVYILGTIFNIVGNLICGLYSNVASLYVYNVIAGIGCSPADSLIQISITDIFFLHEQGRRLSIYLFSLYAGAYLGPVAAGYIAEGQGNWKWIVWWILILNGVLLVLQIFCMEETLFDRNKPSIVIENGDSNPQLLPEFNVDKTVHISLSTTLVPQSNSTDRERSILTGLESSPIPKKTYRQRLRLWSPEQRSSDSILKLFFFPFSTIRYPAITWCSIVYGIQICWLALLTVSESEYFGDEPYNFSTDQVGLINLASFIGGLIGMVYGGYSDAFQLHLTRKNNGYYEPEFRLWTLGLAAILNAGGLLMYGLGIGYEVHWMLPVFGVGLIGFSISACGSIAIAYAADCYPEQTGPTMVLIVVIRTIIGTVFICIFQFWVDSMGIKGTLGICAAISFVANFSFLIFIKWGKDCRRWTAKWYLESKPIEV